MVVSDRRVRDVRLAERLGVVVEDSATVVQSTARQQTADPLDTRRSHELDPVLDGGVAAGGRVPARRTGPADVGLVRNGRRESVCVHGG